MAPEWSAPAGKWSRSVSLFFVLGFESPGSGVREQGATLLNVQFSRSKTAQITSILACLAGPLACSGTKGPLVVSEPSLDAGSKADAGAKRDASPSDGDTQLPGSVWQPAADATFQLQLTGVLDTSLDVDVYIIDLDSGAEDFSALEAAGHRTVCHFSAGTVETFRDDAALIPESAWGNTPAAYPDERWLDVTFPGVREVMRARLERAMVKGCSAVLPQNLAVHLQDSGFSVAEADVVAYARFIAKEANALGLSAMLSTDELIEALTSDYQIGLGFECLTDDQCARWAPLREAGKTVMIIEVGDADSAPQLCAIARKQGLPAIVKQANFNAFRISCQ